MIGANPAYWTEDEREVRTSAEFTKTLKSDGRTALKISLTREAHALGLDAGDEVVVTIRRRI